MKAVILNIIASAIVALALFQPIRLIAEQIIPAYEFARLPIISGPVLSPDGNKVAFRAIKNKKRYLMVSEVAHGKSTKILKATEIGGRYISDYSWASNDRLILHVRQTVSRGQFAQMYEELFSIGISDDSPPIIQLGRSNKGAMIKFTARLVSILENDPEHVLVYFHAPSLPDLGGSPIHLANIYTGELGIYEELRANHDWVVDPKGNIRIAVERIFNRHYNKVKVFHRYPGESRWSKLESFSFLSDASFEPQRFDEVDNNILLVSKYRDAGLIDKIIDETIYPVYRYDIKRRRIIGDFKNTEQEIIHGIIKKQFPHLTHEIVSSDNSHKTHIVRSYSDIQPTEYYLVNIVSGSINLLGREYPNLKNRPFSKMVMVSYTARDGLKIPAYLTLPTKDSEKYPLIVLPHGGPFSRDEWGFDNYVQFFADRGYAVFQPQFRGSAGFGIAHEKAGYGEWGGEIQNDITDGVKWLLERPDIDKTRICIVGHSFGAYSALFAAATTPEMYKCAIGINGVYDMKGFVGRNGRSGKYYVRKDSLGRPWFKNYSNMAKKSPYEMANNISIPVLLIAEQKDIVVPYIESQKMYSRIKAVGGSANYVELEKGEHWRTDEINEISIFSNVEEFLEVQLGG